MKRILALIAASLIATTAHAAPSCLPKQLGGSGTEFVSGDSPGGYWAAYWCGRDELYVAACTRTKCSGFGAMRMVRLWLENPDTADLVFGADPFTAPALRKIWTPHRSKIDAMRPS